MGYYGRLSSLKWREKPEHPLNCCLLQVEISVLEAQKGYLTVNQISCCEKHPVAPI